MYMIWFLVECGLLHIDFYYSFILFLLFVYFVGC